MLFFSRNIFCGNAIRFANFCNFIKSETNGFCSKTYNVTCFSTSSNLFYYEKKATFGNMTKERDITKILREKGTDLKVVKEGFFNFLGEFVKYKEEMKESFNLTLRNFEFEDPRDVIDMVFTFEKEDDLKNFVVTTDSSSSVGYSSASLVITQNGTALFSGDISTEIPKDGNVTLTGFANMMCRRKMRPFKRPGYYNWKYYTHLVLKVRGDGRTYGIVIPTPGEYDLTWTHQYSYPLCTRGGPYWQVSRIPFSHFFFMKKARVFNQQSSTIPLDNIARIGITLCDGCDGPFNLEIDYIGLEYDPFHRKISPYEEYYCGRNK